MDRLQSLLAQDDTVIFVGSGISRWASLPSWEGLIEALAEYLVVSGIDPSLVRQEAKVGDLLQAASYGLAKLTKPQFGAFIRTVSGSGSAIPVAIHEALMKLGPSCFITTNYDDLLEQAFRRWRNNPSEPRIVLNRQLVEQAEIVQTQARGFIFKPHGDARDIETIVLTREQYRTLQAGGPLNATLTTLMTLLSSRPMLFVGFGLRDPDFLHVRDLLANIYRGGMRDHFAIVADPVPDQVNWWRETYGVHLLGYATRVAADGARDHSALLDLLKAARRTGPAAAIPAPKFDFNDAATVLELARYAAGTLIGAQEGLFPILVTRKSRIDSGLYLDVDPYDNWNVKRLLTEGPVRLLLVGAPGAGKTFAIRNVVGALATALQDTCIQGRLARGTKVPVLLDLKVYAGNLAQQIAARFPPKLNLAQLNSAFPVKLFLDGFNEMPRDHRESGVFDADIDTLLAEYPHLEIVISSRTTDGLDRLEFPTYELSEITGSEVERLCEQLNLVLPDAHAIEISAILRRPFYFRLLERAAISLENVSSPASLYAQYITHLHSRFLANFPKTIDLIEALRRQAYRALELGSEAFSLAELRTTFREVAPRLDDNGASALLDWLVSADLLIPLGGGRASFVHQSITEYLAASRLAQQLGTGSDISSLIALRRWDNVIFLTISMLDAERAEAVLRQIVATDLTFAIRAARFVEEKRDRLLSMLLRALLARPAMPIDTHINFEFERIQFERSHEAALRQIVVELPVLRNGATNVLARILGTDYKLELIETLIESNTGGEALAPLLQQGDIKPLLDHALKWDPSTLDDERGETHERVSELARALSKFAPEVIREEIFDHIVNLENQERRIVAELLAQIFWDKKSQLGVAMLAELARQHLLVSLFAIYLNVNFEESVRDHFIELLDPSLLKVIAEYVETGDKWAADLMRVLCSHDEGVARSVLAIARGKMGEMQQAFEYCATGSEKPVFRWLEQVVDAAGEVTIPPPFRVIDFSELDWSGRNDLLVSLLLRREHKLALSLLGGSIPVEITGLKRVALGEAKPWVHWLAELIERKGEENSIELFWLARQLAFLIARSSTPSNKAQLLALFDAGTPEVRRVIGRMVMPHMDGLTIDDLSQNAIAFLTDILKSSTFSEFDPHVFGLIATEALVRHRLIPLASTDDCRQWDNVAATVILAGRKLGMRFLLPPRPSNPDASAEAKLTETERD